MDNTGQHRYLAVAEALGEGVDELHGFKVYFLLTNPQRLDAQLISNTNIAISKDLLDRMQETFRGPGLREWAQGVGLLGAGQDFSDRRGRSKPVTVQLARMFIMNYLRGVGIEATKFDLADTTPVSCKTGEEDPEWERTFKDNPDLFTDEGLKQAGREYAALVLAQRQAVASFKPKRGPSDYSEKGLHLAVVAGWAIVAGVLQTNPTRLKRHFDLKGVHAAGKDPLNADALGRGRHKTDPENYRGLGYRMNTKEFGRFAELFFLQAKDGKGITPAVVDLAIKKYHAKQAMLEVARAQEES